MVDVADTKEETIATYEDIVSFQVLPTGRGSASTWLPVETRTNLSSVAKWAFMQVTPVPHLFRKAGVISLGAHSRG